jgi:hypothetical protein
LIIDRVGRSTVKVVRRMTEAKAEVEAEKVGAIMSLQDPD